MQHPALPSLARVVAPKSPRIRRILQKSPVAMLAKHLLQALRAQSALQAILVVTSDKVYANAETGRAFGEADPLGGKDPYSASKAALISYLESLRLEMHGSGVKVVTLCPGYIRTPMTDINPYPMPFMLDVDDAAQRFARVIERGCSFKVVPWQMAIVGRLLKLLPNWLYDLLFAKAPHKPRAEH